MLYADQRHWSLTSIQLFNCHLSRGSICGSNWIVNSWSWCVGNGKIMHTWRSIDQTTCTSMIQNAYLCTCSLIQHSVLLKMFVMDVCKSTSSLPIAVFGIVWAQSSLIARAGLRPLQEALSVGQAIEQWAKVAWSDGSHVICPGCTGCGLRKPAEASCRESLMLLMWL